MVSLEDLSLSPLALIGVLLGAWVVGGAVYRLYFSPLAKFPGRKLAIITAWYETYYQIGKEGKYVYEIQKMHEEYGESGSAS